MKMPKQENGRNLIQELIAQRTALYKMESLVRENLPFLLSNDLLSQDGLSNISLLEQLVQAGLWFYLPDENEVFLTGPTRDIAGVNPGHEPLPWEVFEKAILADDRPGVKAELDKLWNHSGLLHTDCRITKDLSGARETRTLSLRAFRADNNNVPAFIVGVMQDVTEDRKKQDEIAREKEKAEESDRLKTVFLSNLSHEFRNPMNTIIGFSELINSGLDIEKQKEYARIITRKGNYLLGLIDDIAELVKFETGQVTANKKSCDINRIAGELFLEYQEVKKEMQKDYIELRLHVPAPITNEIYTDPGRLQQVLSNLLRNAFQFTEKGFVEFGYEVRDRFIQFYVKDTGIGVPKEDQKMVFNRFRQLEDTSLRKIGGSGMGLTLSRHIISLLGGRIWLESTPNEGSTFFFSIPLQTVPDSEKTDAAPESKMTYNWKDKVILIVEDDEINAQFLEAVLDQTQVQTLYASTGAQAIELCRSINKIDLVLMDIKMPEMSGYEACRQIKAFKPSLPMIAQTAFAEPIDKIKCMNAGFDDYLSKPIDIESLLSKIYNIFNH